MKRTFGMLTLADAMQLIPAEQFVRWLPTAAPAEASDNLVENFRRLQAFDLQYSEAAKLLLIDALLAEVVPSYPQLKVWKAMPLESDTVSGITDYLISPQYAFVKVPLLCAVEAKRDDFVQGASQCIAEMVACRWNNRQAALDFDVYGIVSNGNFWQFYRLTPENTIHETAQYGLNNLPELLGVLHSVCAACANNIPANTLTRTTD